MALYRKYQGGVAEGDETEKVSLYLEEVAAECRERGLSVVAPGLSVQAVCNSLSLPLLDSLMKDKKS